MKTREKESVVHYWVIELPFTQQAVLLLSLRGPDGCSKFSDEKDIIHYLRGIVLKPAFPDYAGKDPFMREMDDQFESFARDFFRDLDSIPHHFLLHLVHAAEVIAYNHPLEEIRDQWEAFYLHACKSFHMTPETPAALAARLK